MFTSSHTSSNPYPFHLSPPSFPNIPHHQHDDDDLLVGHLLPAGAPPVSMAGGPSSNQAVNASNADHCDPPNPLPKKQPAAKKDRHSKIDTAQGRRDRRVRLSIGIARKFFDLQDMLGFDKASKTLDWLLTKSKTAITELEHSKLSCIGAAKAPSLPSKRPIFHTNGDPPEASLAAASKSTKPGANRGHRAAFGLVAKESRANARARARERTREKMSTRKNISESISNPPTSNQFKSTETTTSKKLDSHTHINMSSLRVAAEMDNNPNIITHHWDLGSTVKRSTFCALTSVNLPAEFQISGKPWEVYNTHSHH